MDPASIKARRVPARHRRRTGTSALDVDQRAGRDQGPARQLRPEHGVGQGAEEPRGARRSLETTEELVAHRPRRTSTARRSAARRLTSCQARRLRDEADRQPSIATSTRRRPTPTSSTSPRSAARRPPPRRRSSSATTAPTSCASSSARSRRPATSTSRSARARRSASYHKDALLNAMAAFESGAPEGHRRPRASSIPSTRSSARRSTSTRRCSRPTRRSSASSSRTARCSTTTASTTRRSSGSA